MPFSMTYKILSHLIHFVILTKVLVREQYFFYYNSNDAPNNIGLHVCMLVFSKIARKNKTIQRNPSIFL